MLRRSPLVFARSGLHSGDKLLPDFKFSQSFLSLKLFKTDFKDKMEFQQVINIANLNHDGNRIQEWEHLAPYPVVGSKMLPLRLGTVQFIEQMLSIRESLIWESP